MTNDSRSTSQADDGLTLVPETRADTDSSNNVSASQWHVRIGRYRVELILGEGSFGRVYLAYDDELDRRVAVKALRTDRIVNQEHAEAYLHEARALARLDHPGIVPIYDAGRDEDGTYFVVSKYIEGRDLAARIKETRPSIEEATALVAKIAEALHHAHTKGLVHRDIKPANILLDSSDQPIVVDFGVALDDDHRDKGSAFVGTPAYMSPEQARGEGHRVDGRSDIFSLGVVFYELLTGRRPFRGNSSREILEQIASTDSRPPRQVDDSIPAELERICLKAMSQRPSERYCIATDMADDLQDYLRGVRKSDNLSTIDDSKVGPTAPASQHTIDNRLPDGRPVAIISKGLRSFNEQDADFFLELLPGPKAREGIPESIRFWKDRVEEVESDRTFAVGLIYGPSGCGKSSFVKAGLLPKLGEHVLVAYVEATPEATESRLLKAISRTCPGLPLKANIAESLAQMRRGRFLPNGKKLLLIIDQFEQWLHTDLTEEQSELTAALHQSDGGRIQTIIMIRDDFWMAATRFMRKLDIRIIEGHNSASVDLFEIPHAKKVLAAFGRSFDALPETQAESTKDQELFLNRSICGLAEGGRVNPVRLALFAEIVKGERWSTETLGRLGGIEGVGVAFLERTFDAPFAKPERRLHELAARNILAALLPEGVAGIRGHMQSQEVLLGASGYPAKSERFEDLMRILDGELRLITATDPEGIDTDGGARLAIRGRLYYQLTHDYLVAPLREWLTAKQKETFRGRVRLRMAERASLWSTTRSVVHLPNLYEFLYFKAFTNSRRWSNTERQMISLSFLDQARRVGFRLFVYTIALAAIAFAGIALLDSYGLAEWKGLVFITTIPVFAGLLAISSIASVTRWALGIKRFRRA